MRCSNYKEENIQVEVKSLVLTGTGFYVTYGNPVNFMKIGFDGNITIESFLYFTRGVKKIYYFQGIFIG